MGMLFAARWDGGNFKLKVKLKAAGKACVRGEDIRGVLVIAHRRVRDGGMAGRSISKECWWPRHSGRIELIKHTVDP
jgi:hypothetical protein